MNYFKAGFFFGKTDRASSFNGVTVTETEYDYRFVDWHHHENAYFSFVTEGHCRHINRKETFDCAPDSLMFHNCQESHCNSKTGGVSRGFQVELGHDWCRRFDVRLDCFPESVNVTHPNMRLLFYNIYKESKISDNSSNLTIDALLIEIFENLRGIRRNAERQTPRWVRKIDEILHENFDQALSLQDLSDELNLHAVHLSRDFPRYFGCNFSQYVRKIKVEKSLAFLRRPNLSLTDIAFLCGFADQSHFIRCFKEFNGLTPKEFRRLIQ